MSYAPLWDGGPDYQPCHYGTTKPVFRGPEREIPSNGIVALGSTETFGKFIEFPWPERLEGGCGKPVINLGCVNSSVDLYLGAPHLLDQARKADAVIVQISGAACLTNKYFAVHPLRNDRFLSASSTLAAIYRNVDFSEFHFIRHMLSTLAQEDPRRFATIVAELQRCWVVRMRHMLRRLDRPVLGLWLADTAPPVELPEGSLGPDPLFVTAAMLDDVRSGFSDIIEVTPGAASRSPDGRGRMFNQMDRHAAAHVYPSDVHQQVADAVLPWVRDLATG